MVSLKNFLFGGPGAASPPPQQGMGATTTYEEDSTTTTPSPTATAFNLLVESDDPNILRKKHKCRFEADSLDSFNVNLAHSLRSWHDFNLPQKQLVAPVQTKLRALQR